MDCADAFLICIPSRLRHRTEEFSVEFSRFFRQFCSAATLTSLTLTRVHSPHQESFQSMFEGMTALQQVILVDYGSSINILLASLHHAPRLQRIELRLTQDGTCKENARTDLPDVTIVIFLSTAMHRYAATYARELPKAQVTKIDPIM
jgi:hypothetical protein